MPKHLFIKCTVIYNCKKIVFVLEVLTRFTKFGQHKHKFWGYGYNDLCYNTHDIIIFYYQSAPTVLTTIVLSSNSIGVDRAMAIAEGLKVNTVLSTFHLYSNSIGDDLLNDVNKLSRKIR